MSKGYIMASHSKSSSMDYYLRNGECVERFHSTGEKTDKEIKDEWKQIVNNEKYGNKDLKIRGRHDARVSTNYTITLPNQLTAKQNLEKVKDLIKDTPIEKCTYTIAIHRGEKDGIKNSHAHLIVNERNTETIKKDREMISKDWLKKEFQVKYEKTFEKEFSQGKETIPRERIETFAYKADPERAKEAIKQNQFVQKIKQQTIDMEKKPERSITPANVDSPNRSMSFAEMREAAKKYKEIKDSVIEQEKGKEKKQILSVGRSL